MKVILVLLVVFTAQTFAQNILECFAPALDNLSEDREDVAAWAQDVRETSARLVEQRQRCADINRDDPPTAIQERIIAACSAAWSASFAYEMARLYSDLNAIDSGLAAELRELRSECFGNDTEPEENTRRYFRRVLQNVF